MPRRGANLSEDARERQKEAIKAWHAKNTTAISIRIRNEKARAYKELAKRRNQSLTSIICECLDNEIAKEDGSR